MFLAIVDIVRARLAQRDSTIQVDEGIEGRAHQPLTTGANRVVFTPVETIDIIPAMRIGDGDTDSRQLLNTMFTFEVAFAGYDATNPERDLAHRHKCYDLFEMVAQEVQKAYPGVSVWTGAKWNIPAKHLAYGAELLATLQVNVPLFDFSFDTLIAKPRPGTPKPA